MSVKDGVFAQVAGTVEKAGTAKNGPYARIAVKREGSQYPDRVTAWGIDLGEGDRVQVKGWLSWRKSERDGKTYVDVSLNRPELVGREPAAEAAAEWPSAEVPF